MKLGMKNVEKSILLGVLVCAVVCLSGTSFAYFASKVTVSGDNSTSTAVPTAELVKVAYGTTKGVVTLSPAYPGNSAQTQFTVTVTPTKDQDTAKYNIVFNISKNDFVVCSSTNKVTATNDCTLSAKELVYTLTQNDGSTTKTLVSEGDLTNGVKSVNSIAVTQTASGGKASVYTYTLTVSFKETNQDQNHNAGKTFTGTVDVVLTN